MRTHELAMGVMAISAFALVISGCSKKEETVALSMKKVDVQTDGAPQPGMGMGNSAMPAGHPAVAGEGALPPGHPPMDGAAAANEALPPGHPPTGAMGHMGAISQDTDGSEIPLRTMGPGSAAEMKVGVDKIKDEELKKTFEGAWRATFTADRAKRDYSVAQAGFDKILSATPDMAEAYRALAYVALSDGFNREKAEALYNKALEFRPEYPEVHAALAVLVQERDEAKAAEHRLKAKEGGL